MELHQNRDSLAPWGWILFVDHCGIPGTFTGGSSLQHWSVDDPPKHHAAVYAGTSHGNGSGNRLSQYSDYAPGNRGQGTRENHNGGKHLSPLKRFHCEAMRDP